MSSYLPVVFLFIILFFILRQQNADMVRRIIRKHKRKGRTEMNEIISRYIGKDCLVYTSNSSALVGEVASVNENWVVIKTKDGDESVNLDYVIRIKEHPRKSNGKKKSVIF